MTEYLWQWHAFGVGNVMVDAGTAWAVDEAGVRGIADRCMRPGTRVERFRAQRVIDRVTSPGDVVYVKRTPR